MKLPDSGKSRQRAQRLTSVRASTTPPANDGPALDAATERALDALMAATVPTLRAHLRQALAVQLQHLQPRPRRERHGKRPGDDAPVDPLTRAKARALLNQHFPRGGR